MEELKFFKDLKDRALAIRSHCQLGGNADVVSIMNMLITRELSDNIKKTLNQKAQTATRKTVAKK